MYKNQIDARIGAEEAREERERWKRSRQRIMARPCTIMPHVPSHPVGRRPINRSPTPSTWRVGGKFDCFYSNILFDGNFLFMDEPSWIDLGRQFYIVNWPLKFACALNNKMKNSWFCFQKEFIEFRVLRIIVKIKKLTQIRFFYNLLQKKQ